MIKRCIQKLSYIFTHSNVDETHGIAHALLILHYAQNAIKSATLNLTQEQSEEILLASLLHDADDRKYFPHHSNYENARSILTS